MNFPLHFLLRPNNTTKICIQHISKGKVACLFGVSSIPPKNFGTSNSINSNRALLSIHSTLTLSSENWNNVWYTENQQYERNIVNIKELASYRSRIWCYRNGNFSLGMRRWNFQNGGSLISLRKSPIIWSICYYFISFVTFYFSDEEFRGYHINAVSEKYLDEPPKNILLVRKNLVLLRRILLSYNANTDIFKVTLSAVPFIIKSNVTCSLKTWSKRSVM